jgi:hypothetical protein
MIQVSSLVSRESCIDYHLSIDSEHEAVTETFLLVPLLPDVGHWISNNLADVLDDEFVFLEGLASKET